MQERTKSGAAPLLASLVPVMAGLVASVALTIDYLQPRALFCSEGGGCAALRETRLAAIFDVPTPVFGLTGFLALGVASLLPGPRARIAQAVLGGIAGVAGLALLSAQWAYGHFCPYCSVADAAGIASAAVASWRLLRAAEARPPYALPFVGAGAMVLSALGPAGVGMWLASRAPEVIRNEMARTPPGMVTVVDFVDFECPFCRMTNAELGPLIEAHRDHVRVVRRQVPLQMHPHALDAARAACCGEMLGKGDAMADALFSAPVESLTRDGCEKLAQKSGLEVEAFRACVADPKTDARIASDRADFKAAGGSALPTLWIDGQQLVGAQSRPALEKAIGDAQGHAGS